MSHFTVTICLPNGEDVEGQIGAIMERWNEQRDVEPYRDYEEGSPADHWHVRSTRMDAENHARLEELGVEGFIAAYPDEVRLDEWRDKGKALADKIREQAPDWAEDAKRAEALGDNPTWADVAAGYNARWGHSTALAVPGEESDSEALHVDEDGRAYTVSTRNPEGLWDYWRIGGRWREHFIVAAQPTTAGRVPAYAGLINSERGWDSPKPKDGPMRCDGGPKRLIDFEAMRDEAAVKANERYDGWEKLCADTPVAQSWSHFYGLVEVKAITIDQAREQFRTQPRIVAARESEFDDGWGTCIVDEFLPPREEYVKQHRDAAVPGYALVTLEGEWTAPGRMGWFGMSSEGADEKAAFKSAASRYLNDLGPDRYIVHLDCHV